MKHLFDAIHMSFSTSDVEGWPKVDVVGLQLGTAGDQQLYYFDIS